MNPALPRKNRLLNILEGVGIKEGRAG